jgi:hypothetical protein
MMSSSNQTRLVGVMYLLFGNLPAFSMLKIVLRASGTILRSSTMLIMRRGPGFSSLMVCTFSLLSARFRCQQSRALVCQQPSVMVELSDRDALDLALSQHQIAHACARSLAHQHGEWIGFVVPEPGQRSIAARHSSSSRCHAEGSKVIAWL